MLVLIVLQKDQKENWIYGHHLPCIPTATHLRPQNEDFMDTLHQSGKSAWSRCHGRGMLTAYWKFCSSVLIDLRLDGPCRQRSAAHITYRVRWFLLSCRCPVAVPHFVLLQSTDVCKCTDVWFHVAPCAAVDLCACVRMCLQSDSCHVQGCTHNLHDSNAQADESE